MTKRLIPGFVVVFFLSACATESGYKMRTGSETYCAVPAERVDILFSGGPRPYKQIGIVSVLGSAFSSDAAMLRKLQKAAGDLGADAVIVTWQYQGVMTAPGSTFSYPQNQGIAIKYLTTWM